MKKKNIISRIILCSLATSMLFAGGCGRRGGNGGTIAVICKNKSVSFWDEVKVGAVAAGEETNYKIDYYCAEGESDFSSQISFINEAIENKVDAIVIAPNGTDELDEAFKKATDAGIKIININSNSGSEDVLSCISSSDTDGGAIAARNAAQILVEAGDTAALATGKIGFIANAAATATARVEGFKSEMANQIKASIVQQALSDPEGADKVEISDAEIESMLEKYFVSADIASDEETAYAATKQLLGSDGNNFKMLFATNTYTTLGMCRAVDELHLADSIAVIGFNSDDEEIAYIKSGVLDGTVIQNPYNMGYLGVRYALKAINGEKIMSSVNTGVTFISPSNINDDDIQLMLNPENA